MQNMQNNKEQRKKNTVFFVVFLVIWAGLTLWNIFAPKETFSESENRNLKTWPSFSVTDLLDGIFMNGVDDYLNDHFVARPVWVTGQSLMEYGIGKREVNQVYIGKNAFLGDLLPPDDTSTQRNIQGIRDFAQRQDMPVTLMLVPSSTQIQPEKLPAFAEGWDEKAYIDGVYTELADVAATASAYDALAAHSDEYIYYRTDHHWTSYGAYLAYRELAPAMGLTAREREQFLITPLTDSFLGTYHSKTGFPLVDADSMESWQAGSVTGYEISGDKEELAFDSIYFPEFLDKKDKYSYFLGQVQSYVTIYTGSDSGKKLLIFKDSYAHSLAPMLLEDYSEIRLVDLRYLNVADYAEHLSVGDYDEALFLYSTDVFAHQIGTGKLITAD